MKHSLQVQVTRKFGSVDVTLTLTAERMIDSEKGLPEFDNLIDQTNLYFDHFRDNHLPNMNTVAANPVITQIMPALEIRVTMDKGKRYWKVATPQYQEHGIPFWPEHIKASGIDPKAIPDEGHKCKEGTTALVEMVDGKPKRVLKLIA
jgi:hypothetical protein